MALLVLRRVGLCVGQNQMCHLCGWLKLSLKNVRWEKRKIQKRWLLSRLSDGSFVQSLYVYFCLSYLLCRLLGLQVTPLHPQHSNINLSHFSISAPSGPGLIQWPLDLFQALGPSCTRRSTSPSCTYKYRSFLKETDSILLLKQPVIRLVNMQIFFQTFQHPFR